MVNSNDFFSFWNIFCDPVTLILGPKEHFYDVVSIFVDELQSSKNARSIFHADLSDFFGDVNLSLPHLRLGTLLGLKQAA